MLDWVRHWSHQSPQSGCSFCGGPTTPQLPHARFLDSGSLWASLQVGQRRALCVGLNYVGQPNSLPGCFNDATAFARVLREQFHFRNVELLLDPDRALLEGAIRKLVTGLSAGDVAFFHYSGHGSFVPDQSGDESDRRDEVLVPKDRRFITDDELASWLRHVPAGATLMVILDACHSGTMLDLTTDWPGRVVCLSATQDHQQAVDLGHHGAFSQSVLRALQEHDYRLSWAQLQQEVDRRLRHFPQVALLSHSGSLQPHRSFFGFR